jgi:hypothetical protein
MKAVKITINDSGLVRKFMKLNATAKQAADEVTEQMITEGRDYARSIAPKDTGRLRSFIIRRRFKTTDGARGEIFVKNPTLNPPDGYRGKVVKRKKKWMFPPGKFNLVVWMHTSPRAKRHFKKPGVYNFMDVTREWLQRRKRYYGDLAKEKIIKRNK